MRDLHRRPAVLEGESDDYVYLIMPIRLAG